MVVPPDNLALREIDCSVLHILKRCIERIGHVAKHPLTSGLSLDVEVVHRGSSANEECLWLVNGNDCHHVCGLGSIVHHLVCDGVREVLNHTRARRYRSIATAGDGGLQACYAQRCRHIGSDGLGGLVNRGGVNIVDYELRDLGLVVQNGQRPVEIGVAVGDVQHLSGIHVEGHALLNVAGGTV